MDFRLHFSLYSTCAFNCAHVEYSEKCKQKSTSSIRSQSKSVSINKNITMSITITINVRNSITINIGISSRNSKSVCNHSFKLLICHLSRIYAEVNRLRKRMVKQRHSIIRRFSSRRNSSFRRNRSMRKKREIQQRKDMALRVIFCYNVFAKGGFKRADNVM